MSRAIDLLRAAEAGLPLGESHPDAPLVAFPTRIEWEMATGWVPPIERYPAPSACSSAPWPRFMTVPGPVDALASVARSAGWTAEVTYAHGCMPHASHGRPLAPKESWAVRLVRGESRAVAVRMGGSWSSLWTWSTSAFFTRHGTLESFKIALEAS